jgi:segregation and condensation protein A
VRFLAILEMYKQGWIEIEQADRFGDISVVWTGEGPEVEGSVLVDDYDG